MVFYDGTASLNYEAGEYVTLYACTDDTCASLADTIIADDAIKLSVDGSQHEPVELDFYTHPLPPADVTPLFSPGNNTVHTQLIDLLGPSLSSPRPFVLVTSRIPPLVQRGGLAEVGSPFQWARQPSNAPQPTRWQTGVQSGGKQEGDDFSGFAHGANMAYDAARQQVLYFVASFENNGQAGQEGTEVVQTWTWDGGKWTQLHPPQQPNGWGIGMVDDVSRKNIVLVNFGGTDGIGNPGLQVWAWDGQTWSLRPAAKTPAGRITGALAFDAARNKVVLFGGWSQGAGGDVPREGGKFGDTWTWDGAGWTLEHPVTSPPPQDPVDDHTALAYDENSQGVLLFGRDEETWLWDGKTWLKKNPDHVPPRGDYRILTETGTSRVVMVGMDTHGNWQQWTWNGSDWVDEVAAVHPEPRDLVPEYPDLGYHLSFFAGAFLAAYDAHNHSAVLVGGNPAQTWIGRRGQQSNQGSTAANQGVVVVMHDGCGLILLTNGGHTWCGDSSFAPDSPRSGEEITALVTVRNTSSQSISLKRLVVAARGPGGSNLQWSDPNVDWPAVTDITLRPNEEYSYSQTRTLPQTGYYFAETTFQDENDQWHGIQPFPRVTFNVQFGQPYSPGYGSCDGFTPPRDHIDQQADNCGVPGLEADYPGVLPLAPRVGVVTMNLFIEAPQSCAIAGRLCGVDDNRPFVPAGSPDPADPSRNRVHMTLDFTRGDATVVVSPSCRFGADGTGGPKQCTAPRKLGEGNDFTFQRDDAGTITIGATVIQTNYTVNGLLTPFHDFGAVHNHFVITPHDDTGTFDLTGAGHSFPDFEVIQRGLVVYSEQGTHLTDLGPSCPADWPEVRNNVYCLWVRFYSYHPSQDEPAHHQFQIGPNKSATSQIKVSPEQALASFSAFWPGSDVEMSLTSPTGRVIDRDTNSADVLHEAASTSETYTIVRPEPGTWSVNLYGADVKPAGEQVDLQVKQVPLSDTGATPLPETPTPPASQQPPPSPVVPTFAVQTPTRSTISSPGSDEWPGLLVILSILVAIVVSAAVWLLYRRMAR
jgi:hypothetical protein